MSEKKETKAGIRRLGREIALRALFLYDSGEKLTGEEAFHLFCGNFGPDADDEDVLECGKGRFEKALPFVRELFFGVVNNQREIDGILTGASNNWRLDRMSRVDRNVMRLALFEMKYRDDIPPKVSINEAIDLGKSFGAEDSGSFINGILDRIHHQMFPESKGEE